jgi:hypothetical protein
MNTPRLQFDQFPELSAGHSYFVFPIQFGQKIILCQSLEVSLNIDGYESLAPVAIRLMGFEFRIFGAHGGIHFFVCAIKERRAVAIATAIAFGPPIDIAISFPGLADISGY